ncbi:MAG TPA: VCBS repeat-containing protein, partial [Nitrospiria bacterium]|nr:VCBS repeat-containing protein [Nitrospiria bacterium]
ADFNHDHHLDLVVAVRTDKIQIYLGQGNGKFVKKTVFDPGDTPTSVKVWDFNHDGQLDLAVANNGAIGNNLSIFFGKGDGTFVLSKSYETKLRPLSLTLADFNNDKEEDIVVVNGIRSTLTLFLGNKDGTFQDGIPFGAEGGPLAAAAGDFDGDHKLDLAVTNDLSNNLSILLGKGDGTFLQPPINYRTGEGPFAITTGDFSHSGKQGLAVANNEGNSVSVYLPRLNPPVIK